MASFKFNLACPLDLESWSGPFDYRRIHRRMRADLQAAVAGLDDTARALHGELEVRELDLKRSVDVAVQGVGAIRSLLLSLRV